MCQLAAVVRRFEFGQGGRREVVSGGFIFVCFINIVCYPRVKEGWRVRT